MTTNKDDVILIGETCLSLTRLRLPTVDHYLLLNHLVVQIIEFLLVNDSNFDLADLVFVERCEDFTSVIVKLQQMLVLHTIRDILVVLCFATSKKTSTHS